MRKISRIASVVTLLVLATASPALAAPKADHQVPIKGTVMGVHYPIPLPIDITEPWQFFSDGTGQMSHLGRVDYSLVQDSYFDFDEGVAVSTGTITFTAANGDMLVIAQAVESQFVGIEGFTLEGTWTVVEAAGSGRFANASGSGELSGVGDIPGGDALFGLPDGGDRYNFTGKIAYNASDRSN
jgi:hypothetical protein